MLEERISAIGADKRFYALIVLVFAAVALVLAAVGLYAVLAQSVGQRTREIGVRVALGAQAPGIRWMIARQAFAAVAAGLIAGLATIAALGRVLRSFLFEVSPSDPAVLSAVVALIVLVAALAAFVPARRGSTRRRRYVASSTEHGALSTAPRTRTSHPAHSPFPHVDTGHTIGVTLSFVPGFPRQTLTRQEGRHG